MIEPSGNIIEDKEFPKSLLGKTIFTFEGFGNVVKITQEENKDGFWKLDIELEDKKVVSLSAHLNVIKKWISLKLKRSQTEKNDRFENTTDVKKRKFTAIPVSNPMKKVNTPPLVIDLTKPLEKKLDRELRFNIPESKKEVSFVQNFGYNEFNPQAMENKPNATLNYKQKRSYYEPKYDYFKSMEPEGSGDETDAEEDDEPIISEDYPIQVSYDVLSMYKAKSKNNFDSELCWMDPKKNDLILIKVSSNSCQLCFYKEEDLFYLTEKIKVEDYIYLSSSLTFLFPKFQQLIKGIKKGESTVLTLDFELFKTILHWFYNGNASIKNPVQFLYDIKDLKWDQMFIIVVHHMMDKLKGEQPKRRNHFLVSWIDDSIQNDFDYLLTECLKELEPLFSFETVETLAWKKMRFNSIQLLYSKHYQPMKSKLEVALKGVETRAKTFTETSLLQKVIETWDF